MPLRPASELPSIFIVNRSGNRPSHDGAPGNIRTDSRLFDDVDDVDAGVEEGEGFGGDVAGGWSGFEVGASRDDDERLRRSIILGRSCLRDSRLGHD